VGADKEAIMIVYKMVTREQDGQTWEKMIKQLENQIRDLQRERAEIQKDQAVLRLKPCRGDSEIKGKDAKFYELDRRAKVINDTIRGMTRKRQLLMSESAIRGNNESPSSKNSSYPCLGHAKNPFFP